MHMWVKLPEPVFGVLVMGPVRSNYLLLYGRSGSCGN